MESSAAGEFEGGPGNLPVGQDDAALDGLEVRRVEDNQRSRALDLLLLAEPAGQPAIVEAGVLRSVVLELPAEDGVVEQLGFFKIGGREFDVIDAPVIGRVHSSIVGQ